MRWKTGSAPKKKSGRRRYSPSPPETRTHLQTENEPCPGSNPGAFYIYRAAKALSDLAFRVHRPGVYLDATRFEHRPIPILRRSLEGHRFSVNRCFFDFPHPARRRQLETHRLASGRARLIYFSNTFSICPTFFSTLPVFCSALPSACRLGLFVTWPAFSLTLPFTS